MSATVCTSMSVSKRIVSPIRTVMVPKPTPRLQSITCVRNSAVGDGVDGAAVGTGALVGSDVVVGAVVGSMKPNLWAQFSQLRLKYPGLIIQ